MTPEEAQRRSEMDQAREGMINDMIPLWRQMFLKLVEEGFTEHQAMDLIKAFIHTSKP